MIQQTSLRTTRSNLRAASVQQKISYARYQIATTMFTFQLLSSTKLYIIPKKQKTRAVMNLLN